MSGWFPHDQDQSSSLNITTGSSTEQGMALVMHQARPGGAALVPVPSSVISDIRSELAVDSDEDDDEEMVQTRRALALSIDAAQRAASALREAKQRRRKGTSIASHDSDRSRTRNEPIQDLGLSAALSMEMERQGIQQAMQAKEVVDLVTHLPSQSSSSSQEPTALQKAFNQEMHIASQAMHNKDIREAEAV